MTDAQSIRDRLKSVKPQAWDAEPERVAPVVPIRNPNPLGAGQLVDRLQDGEPLVSVLTGPKCFECGRVFDLADEIDAAEWSSGHDCEVDKLDQDEGDASIEEDTPSPEFADIVVKPNLRHSPTVEVVLDRKTLAHALLNLNRVVSRNKAALPVLKCVHMRVGAGVVTLIATDLELTARVKLNADTQGEGEAAIPAGLFKKVVGASKNPMVSIKLNLGEDQVTIDNTTVQTKPASEFPKLALLTAMRHMVLLRAEEFDTIRRVAMASSTDEARPVLTGISLDVEDGALRFVATDSYRLAVGDTQVAAPEGVGGMIVPALLFKLWLQLWGKKLSTDKATAFNLDPEGRDVRLARQNWEVWARVIEGTYPNYRQLLPTAYPTLVQLDYDQTKAALKQATVLAEDHVPIRLEIKANTTVTMSVTRQDVGGFTLPVAMSGLVEGEEMMTAAFNSTYFDDGIECSGPGVIDMRLLDPLKPAVLQRHGDPSVTYLLMPVRL